MMHSIKIGQLVKRINYCGIFESFKTKQCLGNSIANDALSEDPNSDWNKAMNEAEKIIGYPTSFLNLRWLLNDEVANVALHLRKFVGPNHSLLKTVKNLLYNGKTDMQVWGLIVLLISKAAGHSPNISAPDLDKSVGILHSQRALAEITEMIRISRLVHIGLVNLPTNQKDNDTYNNMISDNKIALLTGDYLLSRSLLELSQLKNQELLELISSALRDQCESEFVGARDAQNIPLPAIPCKDKTSIDKIGTSSVASLVVSDALGNARAEWTLRHMLASGSLLGKSCQGALKLAGHPTQLQEQGYLFGIHLSLAWQACLDNEPFQTPYSGSFSLISAPVMFHLEHDSSLYPEIEKGSQSVDDVDYKLIHEAVLSGPGLGKTKQLQNEHSQSVIDILHQLPQSDARTALTNIIFAMQE